MSNPDIGRVGVDRIVHAARHSIAGLKVAFRDEAAFRQECWLAVALTPFAFWIGRNWVEVTLLVGSLLFVLIVELLNSAIEAAVDRVSLEWHEVSKRAKDLASAAVFVALLLTIGIWTTALWQRLT